MLVNVGSPNLIESTRIVCVSQFGGLPILTTVREARKAKNGTLIDLTKGRQSRAVIFTDCGLIILTAISPTAIKDRLDRAKAGEFAQQHKKSRVNLNDD